MATPGDGQRVLAPQRLAQDLDDEVSGVALVQDPLDDIAERARPLSGAPRRRDRAARRGSRSASRASSLPDESGRCRGGGRRCHTRLGARPPRLAPACGSASRTPGPRGRPARGVARPSRTRAGSPGPPRPRCRRPRRPRSRRPDRIRVPASIRAAGQLATRVPHPSLRRVFGSCSAAGRPPANCHCIREPVSEIVRPSVLLSRRASSMVRPSARYPSSSTPRSAHAPKPARPTRPSPRIAARGAASPRAN